ncbi:hypothetical protein ABT160_13935 [Streptomyces sp. NPDC001941]|uniref:hypothetical protein n=1 Tax=Streptomyces sp. NPDC001941 TaxID=3154659 RepID=UPI00331BC16E
METNRPDPGFYEEQAAALRVIVAHAAAHPHLAAALAAVSLDALEADALTPAELDQAARWCDREAAVADALAERHQRAAEAGVPNAAYRCVCGCSAIRHAARVTDDRRVPCTRTGCACDDLTYAPVAAA